MTRFASRMGAAAVAAAIMGLLSGCGQGPGSKQTDYAAALAGTWISAAIPHKIPDPRNPTDTTNLVDITTTATATIGADGADAFTISASDVRPPGNEPFLVTTVTGTFIAGADTITVMVTDVSPPSAVMLIGEGVDPVFGYEVTDTELKLSGSFLVEAGVTQSHDEKLTLTRQ